MEARSVDGDFDLIALVRLRTPRMVNVPRWLTCGLVIVRLSRKRSRSSLANFDSLPSASGPTEFSAPRFADADTSVVGRLALHHQRRLDTGTKFSVAKVTVVSSSISLVFLSIILIRVAVLGTSLLQR